MIKKLLLSSFVLSAVLCCNIAFAEESCIREDLLPAALHQKNDDMFVQIPNKPDPQPAQAVCPKCNQTPCACEQSVEQTVEQSAEQVVEQAAKPVENNDDEIGKIPKNCEEHNNPQLWTDGPMPDQDIIDIHNFFSKADSALGLTPDQKTQSNYIKKDAVEEITDLKRDIAQKKGEINVLKNSKSNDAEYEAKELTKEIKSMENDLKRVFKNTEREYRSILNPQQRKLYNAYKKSNSNKTCK